MQTLTTSSTLPIVYFKRKKETCIFIVSFFLFFICLNLLLNGNVFATEKNTTQEILAPINQNIELDKTDIPNPTNNNNQTKTHSQSELETDKPFTPLSEENPATDYTQNVDFGWQKYFQAIGTMLFLLLALWYVLKLVKRYGQGRFLPNQKLLPKNTMYLEGQLSLGPNKCVTIVNVLNRRLVLGVTEKDITLLTEIYEVSQNKTEQDKTEHDKTDKENRNCRCNEKKTHIKNTHNHNQSQELANASQAFQEHLYAETQAQQYETSSTQSTKNQHTNKLTTDIHEHYFLENTLENEDTKMSQIAKNTETPLERRDKSPSGIYANRKSTVQTTQSNINNNETSYEKRASRLLNAFKRSGKILCLLFASFFLFPSLAFADIPSFSMTLSGGEVEPSSVSLSLEILFLFTILSLAPAIAMTVTSFTRIIIVFHFIRQAMGIQQIPPTQILASLAIFMSIVIMYPVGQDIHDNALQPYLQERISFDDALERAQIPIRNFMFKHTREKDMSLFYSIAQMEAPQNKDEVPTIMLAAAFVISEFKTAFSIGFLIYIPFLIVDMVVSSILLAMGMMMLPPMMVSMPFKLLLFVVVDGWNLLIGSLVNSFLSI